MDRLGKYEIRGVLGRGAMGTVYEGWDPHIARRVAIKTVRLPDSNDSEEKELLNRFQQEAQAAGRLQHPNIVGVFDYAETDELAYIVMEFVAGKTLKSVLDGGHQPDTVEIGRLIDGLLTGLEFSHEHHVIHRDIKPANIIVTPDGAVKIADFGIARISGSEMTLAGTIMGTPAYMSPEQFRGTDIDARSDIYSAGIVLFQLLTGKRPFEGSMATIMQAVLNQPAPSPSSLSPDVSPALDAIVARAIARAPEERFQTAQAFSRALQAALRDAPAATRREDPFGDATIIHGAASARTATGPKVAPIEPTRPKPAPKSVLPLVLAGISGLVIIGGGAAWFVSGGAPVPPAPARPAITAANIPIARPVEDAPAVPVGEPAPKPEPSPPTVTPPEPTQQASLPVPTPPPPEPVLIEPSPVSPLAVQTVPVPQQQAFNDSQPAPTLPAQPPLAVPTPPPPRPLQLSAIAAALQSVSCSAITGDERPAGTLSLNGAAEPGVAERKLRDGAARAAPGAPVDWQVAEVQGPYCGLLDLLRPAMRPFGAVSQGLVIKTSNGRTDLSENDLVVVRATMPDFPGHLQLDYVSSDGGILHMRQSTGTGYPANAAPVFGQQDAKFHGWEIGCPFGTDLVIGVASSAPLFRTPRPGQETLDLYLRDFQAAMERVTRDGGRVAAGVLVLRTRPLPAAAGASAQAPCGPSAN